MPIVREGESILCSKGHPCGRVTATVEDGETITCNILRIDLDVADFARENDGHVCKPCNERITKFGAAGAYAVRTASGWVGNVG
jgi:hypothetical protein